MDFERRDNLLFRYVYNEKGALFPIAVALLFIVTSLLTYYVMGYEAQLKTYNALEIVNVRATISILGEIRNNM